jgi:hypothetical protein
MLDRYGTDEQKAMIDGSITGKYRITFGLTEPEHGSDATHMETRAVPATRDNVKGWIINGQKMWTTGMHVATHCALFARTSGNDGDARGITCLLVPAKAEGVKVEEYMWTFNMPTDHPRVSFTDVFVPDDALFGEVGRGLSLAQCFVHENRIRQAASSLGAAVYCINESVKYARERKPFGKALAENQAIQWPLVELATQAEMLRLLIRKTAWEMDQLTQARSSTRSPTGSRCATSGQTACAAKPPTAPCRCMAAWAIRATSRSNTSTATTAATASPKAARKSRSARWRDFCSGIWGRGSIERPLPSSSWAKAGRTMRSARHQTDTTGMLGHASLCRRYEARSIHLPILPRPIRIAQIPPQNLARRIARQRLQKSTVFGVLKPAMRSRVKLMMSVAVACLAGLHHHDRLHRFAPFVVGDADHGGFGDIRVIADRALDFGGIDVLAAGDDHVLDAVVDVEVAVLSM